MDANSNLLSESTISSMPRALLPVRVCVCTSYAADREPRGPRHARALFECGGVDLTFIDAAPENHQRQSVRFLDGVPVDWRRLTFPIRGQSRFRWGTRKLRHRLATATHRVLGLVSNDALNANMRGMENLISAARPDIILAHNIDTLLPAYLAAQRCDAMLMFDSMEFHSDMGDGQDTATMRLINEIETMCLPRCSLVTTSGPRVSKALSDTYRVKKLLSLYNAPPTCTELATTKVDGFSIYWRNSTIGLGQRGLEDAIRAMTELPEDIRLHLQGRPSVDGGTAVAALASRLGIGDRIVIHPPYRPEEAVQEASRFHIGLCLERAGIRNHELTVSNKMFDYHMAGLAVIASDLPALRDVVEASQAGLLYRPGDVTHLRNQIMSLYEDRSKLQDLSTKARRFALSEGNLERVMQDLTAELTPLLEQIRRTRFNAKSKAENEES